MRPWHTFVITFAIAFILALGNGLGFFESTLSAFIAGILASVAFQILLWIFKPLIPYIPMSLNRGATN